MKLLSNLARLAGFLKITAVSSYELIPGQTCGVMTSQTIIDNKLPWHAVFYDPETDNESSATIISNQWLVSRQNAKLSDNANDIKYTAADYSAAYVMVIKSNEEMMYPLSNIRRLKNPRDILLLRTEMPIDLSDSVYPACLPSADLCLNAEEMVLTSSIDGFNGEIEIQAQEDCVKDHFSDSDYHFENSVCATDRDCLHTDIGSSLAYPENSIYGKAFKK